MTVIHHGCGNEFMRFDEVGVDVMALVGAVNNLRMLRIAWIEVFTNLD